MKIVGGRESLVVGQTFAYAKNGVASISSIFSWPSEANSLRNSVPSAVLALELVTEGLAD
jgi:hypothetical protein